MKFEKGEEIRRKNFEKKNEKGKVSFFEEYKDVNNQEIPKLLEKRKEGNKAFKERELERKRKLREAEKDGIIFLKDIK